jgi:short-subunit dehydrogenase
MNLDGRSVLLTGATGGIGHALARRLAAAGATLTITGRRTDRLDALVAELGGGTRALAVDLADADAVAGLAETCAEVDVLVANAGLPAAGNLMTFSIDELDRALDVNLRAPMVLARVLGERMAARGSGHLLFVSSLAGKVGSGGSSVYSATKFGLRGFAHGLREDLAPRGVGVSVVLPGFIRDAGMFHESGTKLPWGVGTSAPEEVAEAVVRAIERNRGEIEIAPIALRIGATFGAVAPGLAEVVKQRLGGAKVAAQLDHGQRAKR